jgi:hypothetical protein
MPYLLQEILAAIILRLCLALTKHWDKDENFVSILPKPWCWLWIGQAPGEKTWQSFEGKHWQVNCNCEGMATRKKASRLPDWGYVNRNTSCSIKKLWDGRIRLGRGRLILILDDSCVCDTKCVLGRGCRNEVALRIKLGLKRNAFILVWGKSLLVFSTCRQLLQLLLFCDSKWWKES